jgi:hypothetical protein
MLFGLSSVKRRVKRFVGSISGLSEPIEYVPVSDSEKLGAAEEDKVARYKSKLDKHKKNEEKTAAYRAL